MYGAGVYAWYVDKLPERLRKAPQVHFEIDDARIIPITKRDGTKLGFFRIPGSIGDYVENIDIIRFENLRDR